MGFFASVFTHSESGALVVDALHLNPEAGTLVVSQAVLRALGEHEPEIVALKASERTHLLTEHAWNQAAIIGAILREKWEKR